MEDKQIIQLLWNRTELALEVLAQKFGRRLLSAARNILGNLQDAEETVSDTYWAVWNSIPPNHPDPLAGFVFKTGRNLALKRYRANSAQKRRGDYDLSLDELAGCIPAPALEETVEARDLGRAIDAFLDTLPRNSRDIFLRRYWFGDSVKDIARQLGISANTVSVRLGRTRSALREHLIKEGYYHE